DFQGHNPDVPNSQYAFVGSGSEIRADAGEHGDAGSIVVWADGATQFYGRASAHGGSEDGNGGQVEVSGKGQLQFHGHIDLSAAHGDIGTLLLDPTNIVIANGSGD